MPLLLRRLSACLPLPPPGSVEVAGVGAAAAVAVVAAVVAAVLPCEAGNSQTFWAALPAPVRHPATVIVESVAEVQAAREAVSR